VGGSDPTPVIGGTFPSVDAKQEWKQVLEHMTQTTKGRAWSVCAGWALNPEFSTWTPFLPSFGFELGVHDRPRSAQDDPTSTHSSWRVGISPNRQKASGDAIEQATAMHVPLPIALTIFERSGCRD